MRLKSFVSSTLVIAAVFAQMGIVSDAEAYDRRVRIVNNSSYTIERIHATHVGRSSWSYDLLGQNVIPSGWNWTVNLDDGTGYCRFDFKIVFEDGDVMEDYGKDICTIGTIYVNN